MQHHAIRILVCALLTLTSIGGCGLGSFCDDAILNGSETDLDCGGSCPRCEEGRACKRDSDCVTNACAPNDVCGPAVLDRIPPPRGEQVYSIDIGPSASPVPAGQLGYQVVSLAPEYYRVTWVGKLGGLVSSFSGTVWTTGTFRSFATGCGGLCPLQSRDVINPPQSVSGGTVITFYATAYDGAWGGFDFSSTVEPVYLDLEGDGISQGVFVTFSSGGQLTEPDTDPFALTTDQAR